MPTIEKETVDDWFSVIKLPLTMEQFHGLPRNAAYKYEYINGCAWLTPRPKPFRARLRLATGVIAEAEEPHEPITISVLQEADWQKLPPVFSVAFCHTEPFASLSDSQRLEAATTVLRRTRRGGDGTLVEQASFVAIDSKSGNAVGAIVVTSPPEHMGWSLCGKPHLSWIFVAPVYGRCGVGTSLLRRSTQQLRADGFTELISTFLLGNDASVLWHWRNRFELMDATARSLNR